MNQVIVFAGTTEGNEVSRFLSAHKIHTCVCVATEYGEKSLLQGEYAPSAETAGFLTVRAGRMTMEEMVHFFQGECPELVVDATHPYAQEVTKNIRQACQNAGVKYQRVLRTEEQHQIPAVYVESTEAAVEYLKSTTGNVLLTTGSKELVQYTNIPDYQKRLFARVLSLPAVISACKELGFEGKNLIGMQGPFSRELNAAMLRQYDCRYLVTKDTGTAGGFAEKMEAALECGVTPIVIGRPVKEEGLSVQECKAWLEKWLKIGVSQDERTDADVESFGGETPEKEMAEIKIKENAETDKQKISLVGIGMGSRELATWEAIKAVEKADLLIGAGRMLEAAKGWKTLGKEKRKNGESQKVCDSRNVEYTAVLQEYRCEKILEYIQNHPEYKQIVILLSGDVGFYSGAKKLLERLPGEVNVICGISSVVYFMSKIGLSWDDTKIVSVHGRNCSLISWIKQYRKVFSILGTGDAVAELAKKLNDYGLGEVLLYVGENLSYENEKIFVKPAKELMEYQGEALCVVCAYHEEAELQTATHGIRDEEFQRGSAPMTKEEVRTVSLAKLRLAEDSVCYDVGAGTGSVAIEMALRAHQGRVYAIEKKEEAAELIAVNKRKFVTDNLEIIKGEAPEMLKDLPAPTHAFIGGSSGNLRQIIEVLLQKNPQVRIVINCITLETVSETLECIRTFGFKETEMVQVGISRAKELGRYHLMMGENPIYVITCQNSEKEERNVSENGAVS